MWAELRVKNSNHWKWAPSKNILKGSAHLDFCLASTFQTKPLYKLILNFVAVKFKLSLCRPISILHTNKAYSDPVCIGYWDLF